MSKSRQILGTILFCLMLMFNIGHLAFMHSHVLSSGTVTHSHPYLPFGDDASSHSHDSDDFDFLQIVDASFDGIILTEAAQTPVIGSTAICFADYPAESGCCVDYSVSSLRAPPSLA
ncbi:MAG: hypothetical protein MJY97_08860 [Bacteroidales bacterium]|nr:hypothetical protein [Bacteroidales bacterium]